MRFVSLDGVKPPFLNKVKNLSIYLDQALSSIHQISEVSRKMFTAAGSLRRLRNFLPIPTILDYADVYYPNLAYNELNKLQ